MFWGRLALCVVALSASALATADLEVERMTMALSIIALLAVAAQPLSGLPFDSDGRMAVAVLVNFLGVPRSAVTVKDVGELPDGRWRISATVAKTGADEQGPDVSGDLQAQVALRGGYVAECDWRVPWPPGNMQLLKAPPWPQDAKAPIEALVAFIRGRLPGFGYTTWRFGRPPPVTVYRDKAGTVVGVDIITNELQSPALSPPAFTGSRLIASAAWPGPRMVRWKYTLAPFVDASEAKISAKAASATALKAAKEAGWAKGATGPISVDPADTVLALSAKGGPAWAVAIRIPVVFKSTRIVNGKPVPVETPAYIDGQVAVDALTGKVRSIRAPEIAG